MNPELLGTWTLIAIEVSAFLLFVSLILERRKVISALQTFCKRKTTGIPLVFILSIAGWSAVHFRPPTHLIMFDEQIYQQIAQMIAARHQAVMALDADVHNLAAPSIPIEYNKQPPGFPAYLAPFFKVIGVGPPVAFAANLTAYLFAILVTFAIARMVIGERLSAFFSACIFALTPTVIIWTRTSAAEISTSLFAGVAFLAALVFKRYPTPSTQLAVAASLSLASYFRPEAFLLIGPIGLVCLSKEPRDKKKKPNENHGSRRFTIQYDHLGILVMFLILTIPLFFHSYYFRNHSWGSNGDKFSWDAVPRNLYSNGLYFLLNQRFPVLITFLALLGLRFQRMNSKAAIFSWFITEWGIFIPFYAGSYDYGMDVRYSVLCAMPVAVFAGGGMGWLLQSSQRWKRGISAFILSDAVLLCMFVSFLPYISEITDDGADSRTDMTFVTEQAHRLPDRSYVFSNIPSAWLIQNTSAGQALYAKDTGRVKSQNLFERFPGGVYFHQDYWCNAESLPSIQAQCRWILSAYDSHFISASFWRHRRTALYRLYPRH